MHQEPVQLMAHQEEGIEFLVRRRAGLLAFEQGLGKTLVAIKAFVRLLATGDADAMLVVCPNSLKRNWLSEIHRFEPGLEVEIIEGGPKQRRRGFSQANAPVVIVSYETARTEVSGVLALLGRRRFVLVLDESHAVKNRSSLTSIAAHHFGPECAFRWLLSGTPITNSVADIWAQVGIIASGRPLGNFDSFMATYGSSGVSDTLRARLAPYVFRRTKADCLDLPPKTFVDLRIELPPWQRALYDQMRDELVCEIESMSGEQFSAFAPTALSRLLRLSQLASNPGLLVPIDPRVPAKFEELDYLVDEIIRGSSDKMIIWSYYVATLEQLADRYADLKPVTLYGATDNSHRQEIAKQFQSSETVRLLIGNPAAAGTGFTFTAARYAVYETLSWRYDLYAQSQDRIHRIGQERPVTYMRLLAADTIEEVIVAALERKSDLARGLLGDPTASAAVAQLSRQEFCELLLTNKLPG